MIIVGFIISFFIIKKDTKKYSFYALVAFIGITACILYLFLYGTFHKGAQNWLSIGPIKFQPSEFLKPIVIVCLALIFDKAKTKLRSKKSKHFDIIGLILVVGLFNSVIIFLERDLGTMLILTIIFIVMFMASPILKNEKRKSILFLLIIGVCGLLVIKNQKGYILSEEQLTRFNFINPCKNYLEGGYQICNAYIAINNGGLFGLGIGKSQQKYSYIPEPHTDMVFAIIAEEQGLADKITLAIDDPDKNLQRLLFGMAFRNPWTKFVKRDFLIENEIIFPEVISGGDFLWVVQVFCYAKRLLRLPIPLYFYRASSGSVSRNKKNPAEQCVHWISSFVVWAKALGALAGKISFLRKNPAYCQQLLKMHLDYCLRRCGEERLQFNSREIFEVLFRAFDDELLVPFFISLIDENTPGKIKYSMQK